MDAPAPPAAPPATDGAVTLDFDPARDGFSFANRFEWTDADLDALSAALRPLAALPFAASGAVGGRLGGAASAGAAVGAGLGWGLGDALVRSTARRWSTFGLCGGMALAAVERWPARGRLATSALERGPIRALLRRRQEATLRASLPRFARYWALVRFAPGATPHAPLAGALAAELDRVEAALRAGRPALLGVVGDAPDPFQNHQVAAFGVDRRGRLDATLQVYDPNAPGQTKTITTAAAPGGQRTAISTDMDTGRRPDGRVHVSTRPGHLSHLFVIDPA